MTEENTPPSPLSGAARWFFACSIRLHHTNTRTEGSPNAQPTGWGLSGVASSTLLKILSMPVCSLGVRPYSQACRSSSETDALEFTSPRLFVCLPLSPATPTAPSFFAAPTATKTQHARTSNRTSRQQEKNERIGRRYKGRPAAEVAKDVRELLDEALKIFRDAGPQVVGARGIRASR